MNKKLLLFWQNTETRRWFTVGLLEFINNEYSFKYSKSAHKAHLAGDFIPFGVMRDFNKTYTSKTLFPLFKNRLLDKSRPEYAEYLDWLGLSKETASDMDELSRSGGVRATDQLQILPYPEKSPSGKYCVDFFVHGIRHLNKEGANKVSQLSDGEKLLLIKEDSNQFDSLALAVSTPPAPVIIGYCPRFFAKDFRELLELNEEFKTIQLFVSQVNMDAPLQYRLRCRLEAVWPDDFSTFADEEFGVLSFGLTRATALQAWQNGDISLGKMAELLKMEKQELRSVLANINLPVIDTDEQDAIEEARQLLGS